MNDNFLFMVCYTQNFILIKQCCGSRSASGAKCFGPTGSASVIHKYRSGSGFGSFHHQANIVRKTLTFNVFLQFLYDFYI
jgi:hypothetical protein